MNSKLFCSIVLLCGVLAVTPGLASRNESQADAENEQSKKKEEVNSPPAKIVDAWCVGKGKSEIAEKTTEDTSRKECFVYHSLLVEVENLGSWKDVDESDADRLLLVLNGVVLKGALFGRRYQSPRSAGNEIFRFDLDKSRETARPEWRELMARVKVYEPVPMSLGLAPATVSTGDTVGPQRLYWDQTLPVQAAPFRWFAVAAVSFLGLLVFFAVLARQSDILRGAPTPSGRKPLSLGRLQMAWWFFIVVGSFIYIFVVLGDYNTLTAGVLTLIGISAATGFAGASLDTTKKVLAVEMTQEKAMLEAEKLETAAAIVSLDAQVSATPPPTNLADLQGERASKQLRLGEINARLAKIAGQQAASARPAALSSRTGGSYLDIFREGDGISFHRFQIVVWSIVLGIVFLISVWSDLAMPDFDATLLGLMGISSGTYVGFKFPSAGGNNGEGP